MKELIDNPPEVEEVVVVKPKVVVKKKGPEVIVEEIKNEDVEKLYKRLPNFEYKEKRVDFNRPPKSLKPPMNEKFIKITFPPKEQMKRSGSQSGGKNVPTVELMVRSKYPTGRISDLVTPIRINFSHGMYQEQASVSKKKDEVDRIQKKIKRMIEVSPPLPKKGIWSWENPTTAIFTPNEKAGVNGMYIPSNSYTVTIKAGIKSLRGNRLKYNNTFSFYTTKLHVKSFLPSSTSPRMLTKNPVFGVEFSQKVDPKKLFTKLYIAESGSSSTYEKCEVIKTSKVVKRANEEPFFTYQIDTNVHPGYVFRNTADILINEIEEKDPNDPKKIIKKYIKKVKGFSENTIFFTTKNRLIGNRSYQCYIESGLTAIRGNLSSSSSYRYNFRTMENLNVYTHSYPSSTYENDHVSWYFQMNNPLNVKLWEKRKKKLVTIKNLLKPSFNYDEKSKQIWVHGKVKPFWKRKSINDPHASVYVTLSNKIEDIYGNCLPNDLKYTSRIYERIFTMTASPDRTHQNALDNVSWNISFGYHPDPEQFETLKKKKKLHDIIDVVPALRRQKIVLKGNRITIHGNPVGHKEYVIKLYKKMRCVHETYLEKDYEVKITMYKESEELYSQHNGTLFVFDPTNPTTPVNFTFTARNMEKVRVIVYQVKPSEDFYNVYPMGFYKKNIHNWEHFSKLYKITDLIGLNKKKIVYDKPYKTHGVFNEKKLINFPLKDLLQHPKEKLGQLYICVTSVTPRYKGSIFSWIQSTKSSLDCLFTNNEMVTFVGTNISNGSFIKKPSFVLSSVKYVGDYQTKKIVERDKRGSHEIKVFSEYKKIDHDRKELKVTSDDGITHFDFGKYGGNYFRFTHTNNVVVMKNGKDVCFLQGVRGSTVDKNRNRLLPFVFDDKKMFKPNEKAHFKVILRKLCFDNNERKLIFVKKGTKVKYFCKDPRDVKYIESEALVDDCSCVYFTVKIPGGANLGGHHIRFELDDYSNYNNKTFTHYFQVQEFENPEFVSKCNVFNKKYYLDDRAMVTAQANYYSGAGLYGCDVKWTVTQQIWDQFRPSGNFPGYMFKLEGNYRYTEGVNWLDYNKQPRSTYQFSSNCKTNPSGEHKLFVEIKNPRTFENPNYYTIINRRNWLIEEAKIRSRFVTLMKVGDKQVLLPRLYDKAKDVFSTVRVTCNAVITDISQNVLSTGTNFFVHPCRYYVGIKKEVYSLTLGKTLKLYLIVVDPDGKYVKDVDIVLEVWRGNELKRAMKFRSQMKEIEAEIPIHEEWGTSTYTFVATVFDSKGYQNLASTSLYVNYPPSIATLNTSDIDSQLKRFLFQYPIGYKENRISQSSLRVILDKTTYNVGDIAKVSIISPIFGEGHIFVFASSFVYKLNFKLVRTKERTFEIKVTDKFVPNVQIHCLVLGFSSRIDLNNFEIPIDVDGKAKPIPAFANSYASCYVSSKHFEMKASVTPLEKIMSPSAESKCVVQVNKKGKSVVTLLIVDEAVLALSGYKLTFPITFWFPSNVINVLSYFLRPYISVRKWPPNLKMIEADKKRLNDLKKKREMEIKMKEAENLRKVEARKIREELMRKKIEAENERRRLYQMKKRQAELKLRGPIIRKQKERERRREKRSYNEEKKKSRDVFSRKKGKKKRKKKKMKKMVEEEKEEEEEDEEEEMKKCEEKKVKLEKKSEEREEKKEKKKDKKRMEKDKKGDDEKVIEDTGDDDSPIAMRKMFESTVIFASAVKTNNDGKVEIPFKLPDQLTKYKIWCLVEQGTSYFGFCENSLVASLPFNVRPQVPTFLNFGDRCELGFILSNQADATLKLRTGFRTTRELQNFGKKGYVVTIPRGLRGEIKFPVLAKAVGDSKIQIAASAGKFNDACEKLIKIYSPTLVSNFVIHGELDADANHIQQVIPPTEKEVYPGFGGLEIQTCSTIFQQLTDAFLHVYNYQFDCIEQTASRMLSIYSMIDIVTAFNLPDVDKKPQILNVMKAGLTRLSKAQQNNGGFGWWTRNSKINVYLSNHCAHAILRIREKYPKLFDKSSTATRENNSLLEKSKAFVYSLTSYIPIGYRANASKSVRAFSLYVLACYKDLKLLSDAEIKQCTKRTDQLVKDCGNCNYETNETKAWLCYALSVFSEKGVNDSRMKVIMNSLYSCLQEEKMTAYFNPSVTYDHRAAKLEMLGSTVRENGVILEVLVKLNPTDAVIPKLVKHLMKLKKYGKWGNTNENCAVLIGLTTYFNKFEKDVPDFTCSIWVKDDYCGQIKFKGRETEFKLLTIPMEKLYITEKEEKVINEKRKVLEKRSEIVKKDMKGNLDSINSKYEKKFGELFNYMKKKYESELKGVQKEMNEDMNNIEAFIMKGKDVKKKKKSGKGGFKLFDFQSAKAKDVDDDDIAYFAKKIDQKKNLVNDKELKFSRTPERDDIEYLAKKIKKNRKQVEFDENHEDEEERILNQIKNKQVFIMKKGKGRCYYRMTFKYAPRDLKIYGYDFGFNVSRQYHWIDHKDDVVMDNRTGMYKIVHGALVRVRVQFTTKDTRFHIALCDNIPAGLEVLNPELKTTVSIPPDNDSNYRSRWYEHVNYRFDRCEVFKGEVRPGTYYFSYVCRAKFLGHFVGLSTKCEEMYNEEIVGASDTDFIVIEKMSEEQKALREALNSSNK